MYTCICAGWPRRTMKCVIPPCSFMCVFKGSYTEQYAMHIKICLWCKHHLASSTPLYRWGVFIHHSVSSYLEEWIESAEFALPTADWFLSEESVSSRGCNMFTLAPGKQQINVIQCRWYHQPAKTPETMSASSVGFTCAACCDHTSSTVLVLWLDAQHIQYMTRLMHYENYKNEKAWWHQVKNEWHNNILSHFCRSCCLTLPKSGLSQFFL